MEKEIKKDITVLIRVEVSEDGSVANIKTTLHKNKTKAFNALKDCMLKALDKNDFMQFSPLSFGSCGNIIRNRKDGTTVKYIWQIATISHHWGVICVDSDLGTASIEVQADIKLEICNELTDILSVYKQYHTRSNDIIVCYSGLQNGNKNNFPDVYKILSL